MTDVLSQIGKFATQVLQTELISAGQLSGGASQETWLFETQDGAKYILRRPPGGIAPTLHEPSDALGSRHLSSRQEVDILTSVHARGIEVPEVVHVFDEGEALYPSYVMRFVAGETIARKILRDPEYDVIRPQLAAQCGEAIAKIHAIGLNDLPELGTSDAAGEVRRYGDILARHGHPHPVFELALKWLRDNLPAPRPKCLVHGDFRNGNLIISSEKGLAAIIDWELAHFGDPMEDLGWICVPSWRFGNIDKPVGGFGDREAFYTAYEKAGGIVDRDSARFWEILGTLKWGVMCIIMIGLFESGVDRSVERAAIGRRTSETEIDLLRMLDGEN